MRSAPPTTPRDDRAVSPIVGTVLLVLVTVTMAGFVIATDWFHPEEPFHAHVSTHGEAVADERAIDMIAFELEDANGQDALDTTIQIQTQAHQTEVPIDDWTLGTTQRLPCLEDGPHQVTISTDEHLVTDTTLDCDQALTLTTDDGDDPVFHEGDDCDADLILQTVSENTVADRTMWICQNV